ncbi:hypothetical protein CAEBREN_02242 [Caenorhabditis brenneri]|uniref:GATOR1 complex protein NPRL3 C-terminal HTH domain-containing protein n=1 Tax=Caenorhabditis brenneri TaxID=135651 RepID=G0P5M3_CAEBE|nr:hypothetical protein CAEBREN_02242 [Caenorhabditis brenneri]
MPTGGTGSTVSIEKECHLQKNYGFGLVETEFDMTLGMLGNAVKTQEVGCNDRFDMKINNQRFVGFPKTWKVRGGCTNYQILILFALKQGCDQHTAAAYQTLSNKIAVSFVMLQNYFGFLEREDKWADYADARDDPLREFAKLSFMVHPLIDMYDEVRKRGNIHKYQINFVELGFCDEAHALTRLSVVPKGRQEIDDIVRKMKMAEKFASQFGNTVHLSAGLAFFNPPATLGDFIRKTHVLYEQEVRAKLVVALLRHQMLMQLHQFYYIIKPYSNAVLPEPSDECPEEMRLMIEKSALPDEVKKKLTIFVKVVPFMNGNHHLEDIKYQNNLDRAVIEDVFKSFELVIATFRRPDFVFE